MASPSPDDFAALTNVNRSPLPLQALWHDRRGDWHRAHELAQTASSREGDWVHAYLHRKEGDEGNAGYWYRRAQRLPVTTALDEEWRAIAAELLQRHNET